MAKKCAHPEDVKKDGQRQVHCSVVCKLVTCGSQTCSGKKQCHRSWNK